MPFTFRDKANCFLGFSHLPSIGCRYGRGRVFRNKKEKKFRGSGIWCLFLFSSSDHRNLKLVYLDDHFLCKNVGLALLPSASILVGCSTVFGMEDFDFPP